ncbi:MAG: aminotransferase class IV [Acidobacteria bacterium]|nr:aminotransferase class IV [Acidobacteriota bacterium]
MLHKYACHNDHIIPLEKVRLSPGQAGLLNGWGLFTTIRIYDGHPFAFDRHWKRLSTDAERIKLPLEYKAETTQQRLFDLIEANHVDQGCARIYFIYNQIGYWVSDEPMPNVDSIIYTADLLQRKGVARLAVAEHGRYAASPLAGVKVTSWLGNVWSLDQTLRRAFDEVILLNERGEVAECTAANIFCVRGEEVATPPLSSGCLSGVTRSVLLEIAGEVGLRLRETPLTLQDLLAADEVFITSTTREVQPVSQIEARELPHVRGPITRRLAEAFSSYVAKSLQDSKSILRAT